jgi:choline dehydrogenase-like flavoprotein
VHYRFTNAVITSLVRATRTSARIFFAAGADRVHAPTGEPTTVVRSQMDEIDALINEGNFQSGRISISAAHLMGGCGMGQSARDSVTDGWGRVHGVPWLRVADSSLFPDALEINPYVTVMALADRTAQAVQADAGELLGGRVVLTTA